MKKILLAALVVPALLVSCIKSYDETPEGKGTLVIKSNVNGDVDNIVTRANIPVTDLTAYTLTLTGASNLEVQCPADGVVEELTPGAYTVALSNLSPTFVPAFESPKYAGSNSATVSVGANTAVTLVLRQANAGVRFIYDQTLIDAGLTNVVPTVTKTEGALTYNGANSEAKGYFLPGEAVITLKNGSQDLTVGAQPGKTITLAAQELWTVTLKVTPSITTGDLTVTAEIDVTPVGQTDEIIIDRPDEPTGLSVVTVAALAGVNTTVEFTDGITKQVAFAADGTAEIYAYDNQVIKSITPQDGSPIYIGRAIGTNFTFNVVDGAVAFRAADGDGNIPVGIYAEMALIDKDAANREGNYAQDANIDLMGTADFTWTPIGVYNNAFKGTFDGKNFEISNIYVVGASSPMDYKGLFGYSSGEISNVRLVSGTVSGRNNLGGIAGYNALGTIINCFNSATITSTNISGNSAGGIVGQNTGTIKNCVNEGNITSSTLLGGIAGQVGSGGFVGGCRNSGTLNGTGGMGPVVGGIAGVITGTVTGCYNTGAITGGNVGGLVGRMNASGVLKACYTTGAITFKTSYGATAGGVCGTNSNNGTITDCYWTGYDGAGVGAVYENPDPEAPAVHPGAYYFTDGTTVPAGEDSAWPTNDQNKFWGVWANEYTTPELGFYWKSLGTDGTTNYPVLYWE